MASIVFWSLLMAILHLFIVKPLVAKLRDEKKGYFVMSDYDTVLCSSYIYAVIHAAFSMTGAMYAYVYADGKPGTTYFYNQSY